MLCQTYAIFESHWENLGREIVWTMLIWPLILGHWSIESKESGPFPVVRQKTCVLLRSPSAGAHFQAQRLGKP